MEMEVSCLNFLLGLRRMKRSERLIRRLMPCREFTEGELLVADVVYESLVGGDARGARLPSRYVDVGEVLEYEGYRYLCVERPLLAMPSEACRGCDFSLKYRGCDKVKCSAWDRRDGRNVWYRELGRVRSEDDKD